MQGQYWIQTTLFKVCPVRSWKPPTASNPKPPWVTGYKCLFSLWKSCVTRNSRYLGHLLLLFWHDFSKSLAWTSCQHPPRHCGGTVSASEAVSPPGWTSCIESIAENVVFEELVILNRTCRFYWVLYLKPVLTLVNVLKEMTSQPVRRKYMWLFATQK